MSATQPDSANAFPAQTHVEQHDHPEEAQYQTVSGVTVEVSDIEVDVVDNGGEEVLSSQADPQAYGIEPGTDDTPAKPTDPALS
jgi:hypothetical protein